jgi:hypothetical protein
MMKFIDYQIVHAKDFEDHPDCAPMPLWYFAPVALFCLLVLVICMKVS